jgi:hypothetical protein
MKLRYTVEGKFSATFTASVNVNDYEAAIQQVFYLKIRNHHAGYKQYSNFVLYDDKNKIVRRW